MALTPKQEAFAQSMANGSTQSNAVRAATDTSNWAPEAIWTEGWKLMQIPEVLQRIDELKEELASRALWTKEQSVLALRKVVEYPDKAIDIVSAVKELNSMHGYNAPSKTEITGANGGPVTTQSLSSIPDDELKAMLAKVQNAKLAI